MQPLPNGLTAVDVISDYLREFHGYILSELEKAYPGMYSQRRTRYCLTVPAMWSDNAKATMREAAIRAEIISQSDPLDRLMLISEPEAAALYCEKKCGQISLGHGKRFLICDAGGGTVDLTVFEIDYSTGKRLLKEVTKGSGDSCGSTFLDANMRDYLTTRLKDVEQVTDRIIETMMDKFIQEVKPQFDGEEDEYLDMPMTSETLPFDAESIGYYDGYLKLPVKDLRDKVFDPVVNKVLDLIGHQINQSRVKIDTIFLVGGFGLSEYLRKCVIETFGSRVGKISVPPRGELAVVKGAVYFGLGPEKISQRVARRTYGIATKAKFDPAQDPIEYLVKNPKNISYCKNRFAVYVKKGQKIQINECVSRTFTFWYPSDACIPLYAYDADGPIPRFTTNPDVQKVAHLTIKLSELKGLKDKTPIDITIKMYFGLTEIRIDANVLGKTYRFTSKFDISSPDELPPPYTP